MSLKKFFILIIICAIAFYIFDQKRDFFDGLLVKLGLNNNTSAEKVEKTIRIYNEHPSGKSFTLKKDTKVLSKSDGVVCKIPEPVVVPGMKDGEPGYVDVKVETEQKKDSILEKETIIIIPGLNNTDYSHTTWGEVINGNSNQKPEEKEEDPENNTRTEIKGVIERDTIWDLKDSPYVITGNIFVPEDVILLIEPGVRIVFNGDYSILIEGEMKLIGKKKNMVKFFGTKNDIINF